MFQVGAIGQCHPPDKSEEAGFHVIQLQFQTAPQDTAWSHALLELQIHDQNKDCCFQAIMQVKKQQIEPDMKQQTGSKLGKEYLEAVYCHPAYLPMNRSTPGLPVYHQLPELT